MKKFIWTMVLCVIGNTFSYGQIYPQGVYTSTTGRERTAAEVETMRRVYDNQRAINQTNQLRGRSEVNFSGNSGTSVSLYSKELANKAKNYLFSAEYKNKYRNFLNLSNTGIVILLPEKICEFDTHRKRFSEIIENCPFTFLRGGGKYFSFRQNDYVSSNWADVGIENNWIFSLGLFNQGFLVNLGNVEIDKVSLTTEGIGFLKDFNPSTNIEASDKQYKLFEEGLKIGNLLYRKVLPIEKDKTYGLRVVAYKADYVQEVLTSSGKKMKFYPLKGDKRENIVIAFRIIEKQEDGSIILLWKELQRTDAPEIILPKPEK